MRVLLSIRPEYADKIMDGSKKYEYRKALYKKEGISQIVVYSTMPIGKVIGEFDVGGIIKDSPEALWKKTKKWAGIPYDFFMTYFFEKKEAIAIQVEAPRRYETPLDIKDVTGSSIPPQSFMYLV